jgi:HD-GYP domain-containing protein (c-di-GMP phosphodiesterase class II)
MTNPTSWHLRILYLLLLILICISIAPLWFYGTRILATNQETLKTKEQELQTVTSQSLAQEISLYEENVRGHLSDFFTSVTALAAQIPAAKYVTNEQLNKALTDFASQQPSVLFATVVNNEAKGVQAGEYNAAGDAFLIKALDAAFIAARQGNQYVSNPITITRGSKNEPVMVMARPISSGGKFLGMVAAVVTLQSIVQRLDDTRRTSGLEAYIVDNSGRLVASNNKDRNVAGMDMADELIVQNFLASRALTSGTTTFQSRQGGGTVAMLGTYSPIPNIGWGMIVQRKLSDAYASVEDMKRQTVRWGVLIILMSLLVGIFAAKYITKPLDQLTRTARSIAQRDFSQRADVRSRTEIGELAETFNRMAEEIQHYIGDLKAASEQNHQLFMDSIEMIAAAVDAKDPYTKGHSGRVSQYSVMLAKELGLDEDEVAKIRVSSTLHDVGKIGVEDRVLKKPGVLTNEEFEIMKRHTVMGYEIVRQVKQLEEMLPGIRWHHEALNGKGYPDGIRGDEIPLMVRIISVSDTFDAITTDRPYQAGRDFPQALEILQKHAGSKYDPIVVDAMQSCYTKGELRKAEVRRSAVISVPQPATTPAP